MALWGLVGGLEVSFIVFFTIFAYTIERKYISTFFSTMTAKQYNIQLYHDATTDRMKSAILGCHSSYYESIRGEIGQWVRENWETWNEEQPEWFTDRVKASVPKDMIPLSEEARCEK